MLFNLSLRENIRLGKEGASDKEVEEAAKKAEIHRFIMSLPNKYDTVVGERGDSLSGGQRQRIAIARALMLRPEVVVLDEPVSALDVSIQAQVLNLLMDLQEETRVGYVFISHNLAVVELIADEVLVMYLGKVVERAAKAHLFATPRHPYTQALLASTPRITAGARRARQVLVGELPSPLNPPPGCAFHRRCPHAIERCRVEEPRLEEVAGGQQVACHRWRAIG
jgi:dipeptide transport system ATP-binding protein